MYFYQLECTLIGLNLTAQTAAKYNTSLLCHSLDFSFPVKLHEAPSFMEEMLV